MSGVNTVRCTGPFRVHQAGGRFSRGRSHPTLDAAEAEACRLAHVQPGDAFVIVQEVAQVACARGNNGGRE